MLGGGACEEAGVAREQFETELAQRIGFKRGRFWKPAPSAFLPLPERTLSVGLSVSSIRSATSSVSAPETRRPVRHCSFFGTVPQESLPVSPRTNDFKQADFVPF